MYLAKKFLLLLFTGITLAGKTQECDCNKALDSLKNFIEKNYAGINDKLTPSAQKAYMDHNARAKRLAKAAKTEIGCLYTLNAWAKFFRDHHIQVAFSFTPQKLLQLVAATETIKINPAKLKALENTTSSVEGIYYNTDTVYTVALVKSETGLRHYAAVILASKAAEWKKGDVKFEMIRTGNKQFDVIWYNRAHHPSFGSVSFTGKNGLAEMGWFKENNIVRNTQDPSLVFEEEKTGIVFYKQLDAETGYLRIRSFGSQFGRIIDSIVHVNDNALHTSPYLIIDLRDNGGGSDFAYDPLRSLIYTNPVKIVGLDMLATGDNIRAWEKILGDPDLPADTKTIFAEMIEKARRNKGKLVNIIEDQTDTLKEVLPNPRKIAIIINRKCASTTEQFLLEALQSNKVTLFGEQSMGVLDYSNMREKEFFCPAYTLWYATTRSRRIDTRQGIDNTGIQPHVKINLQEIGWLDKVRTALKK